MNKKTEIRQKQIYLGQAEKDLSHDGQATHLGQSEEYLSNAYHLKIATLRPTLRLKRASPYTNDEGQSSLDQRTLRYSVGLIALFDFVAILAYVGSFIEISCIENTT